MKTLTSSVAGIAMLFAASAQDVRAQDVQIDLNFGGLNLRLRTDNYNNRCSGGYCPPRYDEERPRKRKGNRRITCDDNTGECYPTHPSQLNNCTWVNIPKGGPHGGTHSFCVK